ncbi:MAG: adenylate cyclase [Fusobacteria bacterium]|nr:MAG: adenylate cyclase [Fusobacteriota bacterium]KAF0228683.1 MAG: adenylate [Fusobacteriota bacterium]
MGSEIEIKLDIKNEDVLTEILDDERLKKDFGHYTIISMNADYYDTRDLDLLRHNFVIRIRKENGVYVCTLKKRTKELDSGVLIREEWNKEVPVKAIKLEYFPETKDELKEIIGKKELVKIVETDFVRRTLDVEYGSSELELAVDYGKIISRGKELPIMEVEVELKKGIESDIVPFIEDYLKHYNLKVRTESKFARGVDLFMKK